MTLIKTTVNRLPLAVECFTVDSTYKAACIFIIGRTNGSFFAVTLLFNKSICCSLQWSAWVPLEHGPTVPILALSIGRSTFCDRSVSGMTMTRWPLQMSQFHVRSWLDSSSFFREASRFMFHRWGECVASLWQLATTERILSKLLLLSHGRRRDMITLHCGRPPLAVGSPTLMMWLNGSSATGTAQTESRVYVEPYTVLYGDRFALTRQLM